MRLMRVLFASVIAGVVIGGPFFYLSYRKSHFRNFHVVREGVLYRSGQLSLDGLKRMIFEHGIKTVVTLRYADNPANPPPDLEEELYVKSAGIGHYRIPFRPWGAADGSVPAEKGVNTFLNIMRHPAHYPVLVHCFAGIHRTGAYCAIYRMECENWPNEQAIQEMKHHGYADEHWDVLTYLENYRRKGHPGSNDTGPNIQPASHQIP